MSDNASGSREEQVNKFFDSDNGSGWLSYPPEEFLAIIVNELRMENQRLSAWAKLLNDLPQFRGQTFQINNQELAATTFTEPIMRAADIINLLLNATWTYKESLKKGNQPS